MNFVEKLFKPKSFASKARIRFWTLLALILVGAIVVALSGVFLEPYIGEKGVMAFVAFGFLTLFVVACVRTYREKCPNCGWPINVNNINKQVFPKRDHCPNCGTDLGAIKM